MRATISILLLLLSSGAFAEEVSLPPAEGAIGPEETRLFELMNSRKLDDALEQLNKPLNLNVRFKEMATPLIMAVTAGNVPLARKMIEKGAKVEFPGRVTYMNVGTPLAAAASQGNLEMVNLLLQKGAALRGKGGHLSLAPMTAAVLGKNPAVLRTFIKAGADPNEIVQFENLGPLLSLAVELGDPNMVRVLLDNGARVNEVDSKGQTALGIARKKKGKPEVVELLLKRGAKETLTDKERQKSRLESMRKNCGEPDPGVARDLSAFLSKELTSFCARGGGSCEQLKLDTSNAACSAAPGFLEAWNSQWAKRCSGFRVWEPCRRQWGANIVCACDDSPLVGAKYEFGCRNDGATVECQSRNTLQISTPVKESEIPERYRRAKPLGKKVAPKTEVAVVTTREGSGSSTAEVIRLKRFAVDECKTFLNYESTIHSSNDLYASCLLEVAKATGNAAPCRLVKGRNKGLSEYDCMRYYANYTGDVRGCLTLDPSKRAPRGSSNEVLGCIGDGVRVNPSTEGCNFLKRVLGDKADDTRNCFSALKPRR